MNGLNTFQVIKRNSVAPRSSSCCQTNLGAGGYKLVLITVLVTNSRVDPTGLNSSLSSSVTICMTMGKLLNLLASTVFCNISIITLVA